jgi:multidrug resistance protein, MATE family
LGHRRVRISKCRIKLRINFWRLGLARQLIAFVLFVGYIAFDKTARKYEIFKIPKIELCLIQQQFRLSISTSLQSIVSIATWFLFFMLIEKYMTLRDLAISNLVRMIYLCLSVPSWGFFTGVNTMVSQLMGRNAHGFVLEAVRKTAMISTVITLIIALPITLFPIQILKPLLYGTEHYQFVQEAVPVFRVLFLNLLVSSAGGVYFNGLSGMGALQIGTRIQTLCSIFYLIYTWLLVSRTAASLSWAWLAEAIYWFAIGWMTIVYMRSDKWKTLKI